MSPDKSDLDKSPCESPKEANSSVCIYLNAVQCIIFEFYLLQLTDSDNEQRRKRLKLDNQTSVAVGTVPSEKSEKSLY